MTQSYLHCPNCGHLDRHFLTEAVQGVYCSACKQLFPSTLFVEPEKTDEWVAQKLGGEISIVQKKNVHGRISMGWFCDTKILIAGTKDFTGAVSPVTDAIFQLAEKEAERRNQGIP